MSTIKISSLPTINRVTSDDVLIINDRNQTTSHITWSNVISTIERTNLNFTSSVSFEGNTKIGDYTYYSQEHLRKYPGILITEGEIDKWNEAYDWGNHADAGYLDGSYTPDQSDYAETDTSLYTYIRNKPRLDFNSDGNLTNINVNLDYTALLQSGVVTNDRGTSAIIPGASSNRAGLMTVAQHAKLDSVELGSQRNVQSNWLVTDTTSDAFIHNKPNFQTDSNGNITNVDVAVDYTPSAGVGTVKVYSGSVEDTAEINVVDATNAGLMTSAHKGNLEILSGLINNSGGIEIDYNDISNAPNLNIDSNGNVTNIKVDLDYLAGLTNGIVSNTAGDNATILGATTTRAGLISATDFNKLGGIEDGAQVNINPTQTFEQFASNGVLTLEPGTNTTTIPLASDTLSGLYPPGHYKKVEGIEDGAQANVQSDWNQSTNTEDDFIKNKPTVPAVLNDLTDVATTAPTSGQVLMYNGTNWVESGIGNTIIYGGVHDFIDADAPATGTDPTVFIHLNTTLESGNVGAGASDSSGYLNIIGDEIKDGDRVLFDPLNTASPWIIIEGVSDAPQTNLSYDQAKHDVSNDNGTGFKIPLASGSVDGLMRLVDFIKLDGIESGAEANINPTSTWIDTNDATNPNSLKLSPGDDYTTIPVATTSIDGLMSATDYVKLNGIESGAQVNVNPSQTYTAAVNKGTLTLTPGSNTTELPIVDEDNAGLATPDMLETFGKITVDTDDKVTNIKTSLSYTAAISQGTVSEVNSTTTAVIPLAATLDINLGTKNNAGLMTAEQSNAVDTIINGTLSASTNLGYTAEAAGGTVTSDTGNDASLTLAGDTVLIGGTNTKVAGLMIPGDKEKLDKIKINTDGSVEIDGGVFHPGKATKPDWTAASGADAEIINKPDVKDTAVTSGVYVTKQSESTDPDPDSYISGGIVRLTNTTTDYGTNPSTPTTQTTKLDISIPIATDAMDGLLSMKDKEKYDKYDSTKINDAPVDGYSYGRVQDGASGATNTWGKVLPYDFKTLDALP